MTRRNKYGAVQTVVNGVRFASKAEAKRDAELVLLEKAGVISGLTRQPRFPLRVGGELICTYVGDWRYQEHGQDVVEDRKGVQTDTFRLKWKLAQALHPFIVWRLS